MLYHFTHLLNLFFILESETFMTRYNDLPKFKYDFAISCTRDKSFPWGVVRITLDKNKIRNNFVVQPVSYFKFRRHQAEERIFTNLETFPLFKYVVKIEILSHLHSKEIEDSEIEFIQNKLNELKIPYEFIDKF